MPGVSRIRARSSGRAHRGRGAPEWPPAGALPARGAAKGSRASFELAARAALTPEVASLLERLAKGDAVAGDPCGDPAGPPGIAAVPAGRLEDVACRVGHASQHHHERGLHERGGQVIVLRRADPLDCSSADDEFPGGREERPQRAMVSVELRARGHREVIVLEGRNRRESGRWGEQGRHTEDRRSQVRHAQPPVRGLSNTGSAASRRPRREASTPGTRRGVWWRRQPAGDRR